MIYVTSEVLSARSVDRPTAVDLVEIAVASGLKFIACSVVSLRPLYSTMKAPFLIGAVAKRPRPVRERPIRKALLRAMSDMYDDSRPRDHIGAGAIGLSAINASRHDQGAPDADRSIARRACRGAHVTRDDGDRQWERGDHKAEVDPRPISLGGLGKDEKMDHHPQRHRETQSKPNQIAGGLVCGPNGFA